MIILGIDPGIASTGWGVIKQENQKPLTVLGYGLISTNTTETYPSRLYKIYKDLKEIINIYKPNVASLEELFFAKNSRTALIVGQARGVIILAGIESGLEIAEYTPLEVKQAVVGYGRASKNQMQQMVMSLLKLSKKPSPDDTADALAAAICHANSSKVISLIKINKAEARCLHS